MGMPSDPSRAGERRFILKYNGLVIMICGALVCMMFVVKSATHGITAISCVYIVFGACFAATGRWMMRMSRRYG